MSNTNYTKVDNTDVSTSALAGAGLFTLFPGSSVKLISGQVNPTSTGNYSFQSGGDSLVLRDSEVLVAGTLYAQGVTGSNTAVFGVGAASSENGESVVALNSSLFGYQSGLMTGIALDKLVNLNGVGVVKTTETVLGGQYPVLSVLGGTVASGTVYGNFLVLDVAPAPQK